MSEKNIAVTPVFNRTVLPVDAFTRQASSASGGNMRNEDSRFNNVEVVGLALNNMSLERAEFHCAKFVSPTFTGVNFMGAEFWWAELTDATFLNCNLSRCEFDFAKLENVRFVNCQLQCASLDFTSGNCVFENCSLKGAEFPLTTAQLTLKGCNAARAEFNGCLSLQLCAEHSDFHQAEFNDSILHGRAENCIFSDASFRAANGSEFSFESCRMRDIATQNSTGIKLADIDAEEDDELDFLLK